MNLYTKVSTRSDLTELATIYRRAYDRPEFGENWSAEDAERLLNFYFDLKTFVGITAFADDKIVGAFFSFIKPWHDGKHLGEGELFVDPNYQNQKIGTKLMIEMMLIAKSNDCIAHELVAYNKVAEWYRKIGLENTGLQHMSGNIDEIIKKLGAEVAP